MSGPVRFKPALLKGQLHIDTKAHPLSQATGWRTSYPSASLPFQEPGFLPITPFRPLPMPLLLRRWVVLLREVLGLPNLLHRLFLQGPPVLLLCRPPLGLPAARFSLGQFCGRLESCLLLGGRVRFCFLRSSRDCFMVLPHFAISGHLGQAHHWK